MGGGVSSQYQTSQAFTDLNVELQKPVDGADIKTPRGVSAQEEVVRLRKLLADVAAEADMMQRQEHQQRMKDSKNKHRIKQDSAVSLGSPAVNKQLRKKFIVMFRTPGLSYSLKQINECRRCPIVLSKVRITLRTNIKYQVECVFFTHTKIVLN